jgi:pSer/pThr/pTyr-binding forkhead associated (FHA) protein
MLDLTMAECPKCGASVEMGRLTGILGVVCRNCDAYNEPGAKVCIGCKQPLGKAGAPAAPTPAAPETPPTPISFTVTPSAGRPAGTPPPAPVIHSFPRTTMPPGLPRTTPQPSQALKPATTLATGEEPIPLVTACPSCGQDAGPGQFCAKCGQPLGTRGTLLMARAPAPGQRTATQIFGALAQGRGKLVLERGEGFDGATYRLLADEVAAGRSHGLVLFPDDPCLADHHATFFYRGGTLHVRDEGAPGGLFLRLRGASVPLKTGDVFAVGDHLLRFAGQLPPAPAPPPDGTQRLGSPRPHGVAVLVEEWLEGGLGGRVYLRPGPSVTIGRAGCTINLGEDPYLSQAHAEIQVEPDGNARLRDLGSGNGTFVRVPPGSERELADGDMIRMGREVLRVGIG